MPIATDVAGTWSVHLYVCMLSVWLGGGVVRMSDLQSTGCGFEFWPGDDFGQVVHTHVPLLPSIISWYRCKSWEGNGSLWKRCGLSSIILGASSLPAQDLSETEMSTTPLSCRAVTGNADWWSPLLLLCCLLHLCTLNEIRCRLAGTLMWSKKLY